MKKNILAVDIGSTNIKAMLFNARGDIVGGASEEVTEIYPAPDQVEQDPLEVWQRFRQAVNQAIWNSGEDPITIAAVCLDSHRSGCILLDGDGIPLSNNLSWRDGRAVAQTDRFNREHPDIDLYRTGGEQGLPQHTIFKMLWMRDEKPALWSRCRYLLLSPKDYVLFRMLGRRVTSRSIAQSSGFLDITSMSYSPAVLSAAGINETMLPELYDSNQCIGMVGETVAVDLGLSGGTPVFCGLCDATASQIGSGSVRPGEFTISIGTCGAVRTFLYQPRFEEDRSTQVRTPSPFGYVPSCTVSDAGGVLKWFKDQFCSSLASAATESGKDIYSVMDRAAARIVPGSDGLLLLPCFTGASYAFKNSDAFGAFIGIRKSHTLPHFSRAIMEGVSMSLRAVLDTFKNNGFDVNRITLGGGGARSGLWMQILADTLGLPIRIPACEESSCLGTAIVAAIGLGWFKTLDQAVAAMCAVKSEVYPTADGCAVYERQYQLFLRLYRALEDSGYFGQHGAVTRQIAESVGTAI